MNPLMSRKVTRQCKNLGEWEASEHHMTDEGRNAFWHRQQDRIAAAEAARKREAVVTPILKRSSK